MAKLKIRWALIGLVALVAGGGLFSSLTTLNASGGASNCNVAKRVGLVIDFGGDSPNVESYCAGNFTGTGWQIFKALKIPVSGTDQYPEGFVCRIKDVPSVKMQGCHSTPTYSQGGWAYFYVSPDTKGKWRFSPTGSSLRKPPCGSAEGWRYFGPSEDPSKSPPRATVKTFKC